MSRATQSSSPYEGTEYRIAPTDPALNRQLSLLILSSGFDAKATLYNAHHLLGEEDRPPSLRFLCSALVDLESWGAQFDIDQSQLLVTVPSITSAISRPDERERMRLALERLKGETKPYKPSISVYDAAMAALHGEFSFEVIDQDSKNLIEVFKAGIGTWSMPYRPREGRSSRSILSVKGPGHEVGAGILEIGDDAPRNPPRDRLMGLATELNSLSTIEVRTLQSRFEALRKCLLPHDLPEGFDGSALDLAASLEQITTAGRGRSGSAQEIAVRKRLTYLARLVRAELACRGVSGGSFGDGLRVIRDLTVPRTNVELTVCGALPPFGRLLVGKLVASMACHPAVRRFVDRDFGIITKGLFDVSVLDQLLPRHGSLIVTTRGLYPVHSAQYNGVMCPGRENLLVPLRKLADTEGQTASHISDRTLRLAIEVNESMGGMQTSRVFGAGGAKRQRILAEAFKKTGLPLGLGHASVSRPVYGASLVRNLDKVILFNDSPEWIAEPYSSMSSSEDYVERAVAWWRSRWSEQLQKRVGEASDDGSPIT
jgi:hypothetical protein